MSVDAWGRCTTAERTAREPWDKSRVTIQGRVVAMSFHHIVPFSEVWNCWGCLARNLAVEKCNQVVETFLRLVGAEPARRWRMRMEAGALTFEEQLELDWRITWPGWNIIEGPSERLRSDDPGRGFDEYTHGITFPESTRQERLLALHQQLRLFNDAAQRVAINRESLLGLFALLQTMERTLVAGSVIFFDPGMWAQPEERTTWKKRTFGERFVSRHHYPGRMGG